MASVSKTRLEDDKEDEAEAIELYGRRKKQYPSKASMYSEMQEDEKDHYRKLNKALKGLKKVK